MTCRECLSAIAVADLSELGAGSTIHAHCADCRECARVATEVLESTRRLSSALAGISSRLDPAAIMNVAVSEAIRAERARSVRLVLWSAVLACAITLVVVLGMMGPAARSAIVHTGFGIAEKPETRTIALRCLSPTYASALLRPLFRGQGSVAEPAPGGAAALTVRGSHEELVAAELVLRRLDGSDGEASTICSPRGSVIRSSDPPTRGPTIRPPDRAP